MGIRFSIPYLGTSRKGIFLKRYKRFLADVKFGNQAPTTVHVMNPGSMKSCIFPKHACITTNHHSKGRKLLYSLEAIQGDRGWIGVNTLNANRIAKTFLEKSFRHIRSEITLQKGWRTDFVATEPVTGKNMIIEVKNVSMNESNTAVFPDSVTERGQKHLGKMLKLLKQGTPCGLIFVVQRIDCMAFSPAHWIDPKFAKLFWQCLSAGMWIYILSVKIDMRGFHYHSSLPLLGKFSP